MIEGPLLFLATLAAALIAVTFVRALQITVGWPDPYYRRFDLRAKMERLCDEQAARKRAADSGSGGGLPEGTDDRR